MQEERRVYQLNKGPGIDSPDISVDSARNGKASRFTWNLNMCDWVVLDKAFNRCMEIGQVGLQPSIFDFFPYLKRRYDVKRWRCPKCDKRSADFIRGMITMIG